MTASENKLSIVKKTIVENSFKAVLYNNGIVEIIFDKAVGIIEVKHLAQIKEVLFDLGGGKKIPLYFNILDFQNISIEAQKFAATEEGSEYTLANAVLVNDLAKKLGFNFFMFFYHPNTPTKKFTTRENAFEWLKELQKDY